MGDETGGEQDAERVRAAAVEQVGEQRRRGKVGTDVENAGRTTREERRLRQGGWERSSRSPPSL